MRLILATIMISLYCLDSLSAAAGDVRLWAFGGPRNISIKMSKSLPPDSPAEYVYPISPNYAAGLEYCIGKYYIGAACSFWNYLFEDGYYLDPTISNKTDTELVGFTGGIARRHRLGETVYSFARLELGAYRLTRTISWIDDGKVYWSETDRQNELALGISGGLILEEGPALDIVLGLEVLYTGTRWVIEETDFDEPVFAYSAFGGISFKLFNL